MTYICDGCGRKSDKFPAFCKNRKTFCPACTESIFSTKPWMYAFGIVMIYVTLNFLFPLIPADLVLIAFSIVFGIEVMKVIDGWD
jgi:uncharacterized paraquat-inducible protein A